MSAWQALCKAGAKANSGFDSPGFSHSWTGHKSPFMLYCLGQGSATFGSVDTFQSGLELTRPADPVCSGSLILIGSVLHIATRIQFHRRVQQDHSTDLAASHPHSSLAGLEPLQKGDKELRKVGLWNLRREMLERAFLGSSATQDSRSAQRRWRGKPSSSCRAVRRTGYAATLP